MPRPLRSPQITRLKCFYELFDLIRGLGARACLLLSPNVLRDVFSFLQDIIRVILSDNDVKFDTDGVDCFLSCLTGSETTGILSNWDGVK